MAGIERIPTNNIFEQYINGMISKRQAIDIQRRDFTGRVTQKLGVEQGGWKVNFNGKERGFANLAAVVEYAKANGAVINDEDGNRLAGQTIEEMDEGRQNSICKLKDKVLNLNYEERNRY
jgi:hypothetical protein